MCIVWLLGILNVVRDSRSYRIIKGILFLKIIKRLYKYGFGSNFFIFCFIKFNYGYLLYIKRSDGKWCLFDWI